MAEKEVTLMKGNEAIAHAAIRCGCDGYFGYPITPQSEVLETLAAEKPWETTGMVVLQAESEVASINMVYGGAGSGKKVMTSSSSPGISLMQEGISYMAGAELGEDMVSIVPGTTRVLTPQGGTLQDYAFREGAYVFYRQGKYYFMWSVDDTGSPNYHVAYGTSDSPLGPITVASDPVVLIQDPAKEIYGPAHNSVLQIPSRDEWYVVYHRINKDYLFPRPQGPGFHRQVCIDRMHFNSDGTIQRVHPTREGVQPVKVKNPKKSKKSKR